MSQLAMVDATVPLAQEALRCLDLGVEVGVRSDAGLDGGVG